LVANDLFVESVSDGSSSGFVDDTEDVLAGDSSGILGHLSLRVVEVRRVANEFGWRGLKRMKYVGTHTV